MNRDGSQFNRRSVPLVLEGGDTSCFNLRTVPITIITVSGAQSGVGKTKVAEILLRALKGWDALKITVAHRKGECPVRKGCHTCDELDSGFSIVSNKRIIESYGKDTARFKQAGAKKVLWLRSSPRALEKGVKQALSLFQGVKGLIIESNSALKYLKPDLAILVKRKDSILKPSARQILERIDLTVEL